jgi:hypothetical protein
MSWRDVPRRLGRWFGAGDARIPSPTQRTGEVDHTRVTLDEVPLAIRALAMPPRLHKDRRRTTARRIKALRKADRKRREHLGETDAATEDRKAAGEDRATVTKDRATGARRLSTRQMLLLDALILLFDSAFYFSMVRRILTGSTHSLTFALAILWTLPVPLIIVVSARHLGARIREQEDQGRGGAPRREGFAAAARRAPLSALALILVAFVTLLLTMMTTSRFYGDAAAQSTLGVSMRVTAIAFGVVFVAIPAFAVAVHAMHDPSHRKDMIRLSRKGVRLAADHLDAWCDLLAVAQDIMKETGYTQHIVDDHMAVRRVGDKEMGAHPPRRAEIGSWTAEGGPFSELLAWSGEIPQGIANSDPLSYNWTALYDIFTALELYLPPDLSAPGHPPSHHRFVNLRVRKPGASPPLHNGDPGPTPDPV